eukprot:CAMPEP_0181358128 /NCGR_PEP_ID=MMETSP1106-20121128/5339_1 /TAXON_ID=81844 /ORGANISM="Mantoniella antarctica, Strain SL-175" /LENGTH=262 /DNA_ID=CAMNT_0023471057 /DNA_START=1487 /DNA_END=2276 /DNA_ORIENTATION=-
MTPGSNTRRVRVVGSRPPGDGGLPGPLFAFDPANVFFYRRVHVRGGSLKGIHLGRGLQGVALSPAGEEAGEGGRQVVVLAVSVRERRVLVQDDHLVVVDVNEAGLLGVRAVLVDAQVVARLVVPLLAQHRVGDLRGVLHKVGLDGGAPRVRQVGQVGDQVAAREWGALGFVQHHGAGAVVVCQPSARHATLGHVWCTIRGTIERERDLEDVAARARLERVVLVEWGFALIHLARILVDTRFDVVDGGIRHRAAVLKDFDADL